MANKQKNPALPTYNKKTAAERMLESPLSPTPNISEQEKELNKKKELRRTTGYYRPEQVRFMRNYCESLRKKFNNENIKPPLLQRVLLEIWNDDTASKVEAYLRKQGYDKREQ